MQSLQLKSGDMHREGMKEKKKLKYHVEPKCNIFPWLYIDEVVLVNPKYEEQFKKMHGL